MLLSFSLEEREPIWMALSEFYLDTELSSDDLVFTAKIFNNSPYTLEEIKRINKYEVYPVFYPNLLSMYGVWNGFDKTWLIECIIARVNRQSPIGKVILEIKYYIFSGKKIVDWEKLKKKY